MPAPTSRAWLQVTSILFTLVAIWFYHHGRTAYNAFVTPNLPEAYFAYGGPNSCNILTDPASGRLKSCEDITPWNVRDSRGILQNRYIASCDPGRFQWNTVMGPLLNPEPKGDLWVLSDTPKGWHVQRLVLEQFPNEYDFHPLGVEIFPGASGEPSTLFVVNHMRNKKRTIEVFALHHNPPRAVHIRQLYHPLFWAPNSVAALSPTEFFLSIDHWFKRDGLWPWRLFMHEVESLSMMPLGKLRHVRFDGDNITVSTPISFIPFPNGLALNRDRSRLAVASTSGGRVQLYSVHPGGVIKHAKTIPVPFSPDNLHYNKDDTLIVTGHPDFPAIVRLAKQKQNTSPTWVVALPSNGTLDSAYNEELKTPYSVYNRVGKVNGFPIHTLYQSNGSGWSAGTTGIWNREKNSLVMSGLYTEGIMVCQGK